MRRTYVHYPKEISIIFYSVLFGRGGRFVFEFSMTHSCEIALAAYKLEFLSVPNSDNPSSSPSMESTNYDTYTYT